MLIENEPSVNEWVQFQSLLHKKKDGSVHGNLQ